MSKESKYLRGSAAGLLGGISSLAGRYGSLWLLTDVLSESGYGGYVTTLAVVTLLALVAQFGLKQATVQRVSELTAAEESGVRAYAGATVAWVSLIASAVAAAVWILAPALPPLVDPTVVDWLRLFAVVVPGAALLPICGGILRGLERISEAMLVEQILPQTLRVLGLGLAWLFWQAPIAIALAVGISFYAPVAAFAVGTRGWQYLNVDAMPLSHVRYSGYLFLNSLASGFMKKTDVLLLSALATLSATGGYNVAWTLSVVTRYGDKVLSNVLQPRLSKFIETGETGKLLREFGQVRDLSVASALPVLVVVLLFGESILGVFGPYATQYTALALLTVGSVLNGAFGSIGQILIMGKYGRLILANTVLSLVGNVGLNVLLIPRYGTVGAAAATVLTVYFTTNLVAALEVKYLLGIDTFDRVTLGGSVAVAAGVLLVVSGVLAPAVVVVVALVLSAVLLRRHAGFVRGAIVQEFG